MQVHSLLFTAFNNKVDSKEKVEGGRIRDGGRRGRKGGRTGLREREEEGEKGRERKG